MTLTTIPSDVIGPYSPWPRRRNTSRTRDAAAAGVVGAAAFAYCIVPMF